MNWMMKLERKFGKYAVPGLSKYFVVAILLGCLVNLVSPGLFYFLQFDMEAILHGQVWRLITWIFMPVTSMDFFGLLFLLCVWMWGNSLESLLGTFRMNVYMIQGLLLSDLGGILFYVVSYFLMDGQGVSIYLTTYYLLLSMLLAIALCMPEAEVRLYFVLPVKMKWMFVFELLYLAYTVYSYFEMGLSMRKGIYGILVGFVFSTQIILAIVNMFLFFRFSKIKPGRKHRKRQKEFQAQFTAPRPGSGITRHKCSICGRTELTDPTMNFRYCSKCNGAYEYCEEHLFTHEHKK